MRRVFAHNKLGDILTAREPEPSPAFWTRLAVFGKTQPSISRWFDRPAPAAVESAVLSGRQWQYGRMQSVGGKAPGKELDRRLKLSLLSFGLTTAGAWFWPLKVLGVSGLLYLTVHWYQKTYALAREGKVGIPTLMAVSLTGALVCGYFWIASFALIVGQSAQKLTAMVTADSRGSLIDVFRQAPKEAWVLIDGVELQTPLEEIKAGQTVIAGAGQVIPVDGIVLGGMATVDQHLLTGEARPVEKGPDEPVFAGTVVLSGRLEITVEKAGDETAVAQIGKILNSTTEYKSTMQLRAERLAQRTIAPTLVAGVVAMPFLGPMGGLAVVDSHFRQRMSILAPLALMNYLNVAARHGILIKDGRSLDLLGGVDTLVFDKTGTLTEERPTVAAIHVFSDLDVRQVLRYAACAEQRQTHPIAHAILAEAERLRLDIPPLDEADYKLGYGLTVKVENREIQVGSLRFMESLALEAPDALASIHEECHQEGHSLVLVACDGVVVGAIELAPTVRPEAKRVISEIRRRHGIKAVYIISGDHEAPTRKLAEELGIDRYFAETLPEDKAALIDRLIEDGRFVCYVGDGINDAIALKKSHVSISLSGASSAAVDTAQIVLMDGNLVHLTALFDFAKGFRNNTNVAFALSVGPTLIGIGGAVFFHFTLIQTTVLALISIIAGLGNAMLPRALHRSGPEEEKTLIHQETA